MEKRVFVENVKFAKTTKPSQAAFRYKINGTWTPLVRLKLQDGTRLLMPDSVKRVYDMPQEFLEKCHLGVIQYMDSELRNETFRMPTKKKMLCRDAAEEYERATQTVNHHRNAFVEYFGNEPLSKVSKMKAKEFFNWLMEKFEKSEQTVKKKIYYASACFAWLKEQNLWIGENPFRELIPRNTKFKAQDKELKDDITGDELAKLHRIISNRPDYYRDIRILDEVLYCVGIRPSEGMRLHAEWFDLDKAILANRRTKRINKPPDIRYLPIPDRLVAFLRNEGIGNGTKGKLVQTERRKLYDLMEEAREEAQIDGWTFGTYRKDWERRAVIARATKDDINRYHGRAEEVQDNHYTTNKWLIIETWRPIIKRMFEKSHLSVLKSERMG